MGPSTTPINNKKVSIRDHGKKLDLILDLLKETRAQQEELKKNLPSIITEQLQRHQNQRKLVIHGFPEDATRDQVSKIFSLVGIPSEAVVLLHHLGKPRTDGSLRPLCVEIAKFAKFPHLKTLSTMMSSIAAYSNYSIRKMETPQERREGFLARKAKRDLSMPPADQTTNAAPVQVPMDQTTMTSPVEETRHSQVNNSHSNDTNQSSFVDLNTSPKKEEIPNYVNVMHEMVAYMEANGF